MLNYIAVNLKTHKRGKFENILGFVLYCWMNCYFSYCTGETALNELFTDKEVGESLTRKKGIGRCVIILLLLLLLLSSLTVSLRPLPSMLKNNNNNDNKIKKNQTLSFYVNFMGRTGMCSRYAWAEKSRSFTSRCPLETQRPLPKLWCQHIYTKRSFIWTVTCC